MVLQEVVKMGKKKKEFRVIERPNDDPNAPTWEEFLENDVKPWIEEVLEYGRKLGLDKVEFSNTNDKINIEN